MSRVPDTLAKQWLAGGHAVDAPYSTSRGTLFHYGVPVAHRYRDHRGGMGFVVLNDHGEALRRYLGKRKAAILDLVKFDAVLTSLKAVGSMVSHTELMRGEPFLFVRGHIALMSSHGLVPVVPQSLMDKAWEVEVDGYSAMRMRDQFVAAWFACRSIKRLKKVRAVAFHPKKVKEGTSYYSPWIENAIKGTTDFVRISDNIIGFNSASALVKYRLYNGGNNVVFTI